jgi:WD40 repeat protein/serine/threonine protein kinase
METENINPEGIFHKALEISDPDQRAAYLNNACKGDKQLRSEVEELLKAHEQAGDFLKNLPADINVTLDTSPSIEGPGTKIGHYELLELIGEGGMGLVYLAKQKEPVKRRVALKIIKPGMDSRQVVIRFEAERQALALLDHPNIARVFDAGTTDTGRPYFVMEYVKGLSITAYCDQNKLNIEQRLRLFEQVCEAIHHAHQKGIIHRDIKPSNILVSVHGDRAVPKIIDFGIAKAIAQPLTEKTFVTFQGQLLGTPEYMSPEQVDLAIQDIDTRSDIYSLGVVLYELLAGILPFEREWLAHLSFSEMQHTIREQEPASPSIRLTNLGQQAKTIAARRGTQLIALARRLHRELEWIPLKAMRKDRCRRYKSASEMADDVRNYLNGNPLIAGPETAVYRVKKFVRKHAGSVATVILVAAAIILGLITSTAMYFRAEDARQREVVARSDAEQSERMAQEQRNIAEEQRGLAEQRAEEYRRSLYCNSIALAYASYRDGNSERMRRLLNSCPTDLRGWEWDRLNYISDQSIRTVKGVASSSSDIYSFVLSPDGQHFACGMKDEIKIRNAATGAEEMILRGHSGPVCIAYSPDGRRIVSGSVDKTIKVWDARTGIALMTLTGNQDAVDNVAYSPNGERIASGGYDGTVRLWDANSGKEIFTMRGHQEQNCNWALAFSPDGKWLASSGGWDKMIKIWDVSNGTEVATIVGDRTAVRPVTFSPDSSYVAFGGFDKVVRIWDVNQCVEKAVLRGHNGIINALAFTQDGKRIISSGSDGTIRVWDTATNNELMILRGHIGGAKAICLSPTGKEVYSIGYEDTVKVWGLYVDREQLALEEHDALGQIVFSPDGRSVAGIRSNTIVLWNVSSGAEAMTMKSNWNDYPSIAFNPDGRQIACGNGDVVEIWNVASGNKTMTLRGHTGSVYCVAFSPDGRSVVSVSEKNEMKVWDAGTGAELLNVAWQRNSPESFADGAARHVRSIAFIRDGKWVVVPGYDETVRVWDLSSGEQVMTLRGHKLFVRGVAVSPDGRRIASCSSDKTIKIWDANTGIELMTLVGHQSLVQSVSFSPDGRRIISCGEYNEVKIWDASNGAEVMHLEIPDGVLWAVFSPDGRTVGICSGGGRIILWESNPPAEGYELREAADTARRTVDDLYTKYGFYYEVINQLQADESLDETVREVALQIANSRKREDVEKLRREAEDIIALPDKGAELYRAALEKTNKANALEPNDPHSLTSLGGAQYRLGFYEDALKTLTRAAQLLSPGEVGGAWNTAVMAITLHKLGRHEEAQVALERLRQLYRDEHDKFGVNFPVMLAEVEKLIGGEKQ